ncbi:MAG: hypothetical protein ACREJU_15620 [Nitrospiraceae bacterium]
MTMVRLVASIIVAVSVLHDGKSRGMDEPGHRAGKTAHAGENIRLDPRFDTLVPADAQVEKIAGGFTWVEGPVWNPHGRFLLFSDIPANSVFKWQEGRGIDLFLRPSGYTGVLPFEGKEPGSNGLAFDRAPRAGREPVSRDRRIARIEPDVRTTVLVDRYQ